MFLKKNLVFSLLFVILSLAAANSGHMHFIQGCSDYASTGRCQKCQYGYKLEKGACWNIDQCQENCCQQLALDGSCKQCKTGLLKRGDACVRNNIFGCVQKIDGKCSQCGFGLELRNQNCFPVIEQCNSYSDDGICKNCSQGYALNKMHCIPYPKIVNCLQASLEGCIKCEPSYYLTLSGLCNKYAYGCLAYFRQKCLACAAGLKLQNNVCVMSGCQTIGQNGCNKCFEGYQNINGSCFGKSGCLKFNREGYCVKCPPHLRLTPQGCVKPIDYVCKACVEGFHFVNGECTKKIYGCLSYNQDYTCKDCRQNFVLTPDGQCLILGCKSYCQDGCTQCLAPFTLSNSICLIDGCEEYKSNGCKRCSQNFILFNGQCFPKINYCQKYSPDNTQTSVICSQCISNYILIQGSCIPKQIGCIYNQNGQCQKCIEGFSMVNQGQCAILGCEVYEGLICKKCRHPFLIKNDVCVINKCSKFGNSGCQQCQEGWKLHNSMCFLTDPYCNKYNVLGYCQSCEPSYQLVDYHCQKVIQNCLQVSSGQCTRCSDGYAVWQGTCRPLIPYCLNYCQEGCLSCQQGYHLNNYQCVINDPNCQSYKLSNPSTQICGACKPNFSLVQGKCIKVIVGCVSYDQSGYCANCQSPFLLDASQGICYINGCEAVDASGCKSCRNPFELQNSRCVIANCLTYGQNCCTKCQNGFKLNNQGLCIQVDPYCLQFGSQNQCTKCKPSFMLINGKCQLKIENCLKYDSYGRCSECASNFFINKKHTCSETVDGCIYQNGQCAYCSPPFTMNQALKICEIPNCLKTFKGGCQECRHPYIQDYQRKICIIQNCVRYSQNSCILCKNKYHVKGGIKCIENDPNCLSYDQDGNCQLCTKGTILMANGQCQKAESNCIQYCGQDASKCLGCKEGFFLNRYYQCQKNLPNCGEYTQGSCSKCTYKYFLYDGICFPYSKGCVQYNGAQCLQCKQQYILKNGECFLWSESGFKLEGQDDKYEFDINPIDVRQSKYYIDNLSPASSIGKLFFSSYFSNSYTSASLSSSETTTSGWKAKQNTDGQYIGYRINNNEAVTFYAVQLQAVEGNYVEEFYIEYSVDGKSFKRIQNAFKVDSNQVKDGIATIYFTGVYARAIRIVISKFKGWPACRMEFFYFDSLRFRKITNLKSLTFLRQAIRHHYVDRVDNQMYINQIYFFKPKQSCSNKELCFTGLQLCESKQIFSMLLDVKGGELKEFYLTYSVDGRNYNCYEKCRKYQIQSAGEVSFEFQGLKAQGVRIYPTKYSGEVQINPTFFYE